MKTNERHRARARRHQGASLKQIARELSVAPSTVSLWVRDIELTESQHEALRRVNGMHDRQVRAREAVIARAREQRLSYQAEGRLRARSGSVTHVAGCMLYWAEGAKSRNMAKLTNSDPELIRMFVDFVQGEFGLADEAFRLRCNLFSDHLSRQREIEQFWLGVARLPPRCLLRSMVNRYSKHSQKKRQNRLPYGTCEVRVHRTAVVQHIYGAIQEYGGFERPEWSR